MTHDSQAHDSQAQHFLEVDGQVTEGDGPADAESVARSIALRRLSGTPQTRHQLDEAMANKDVPAEVRDNVLDRFAEVGLIDDAAFARAWVESRQSSKGLSARALAEELRRRGVTSAHIEDAVGTIDPDDEENAARALVERKLQTMGELDPATRTRRLVAMLGRKGYPAGLAYRVVRESVDEAPDELFDV